jgi:hypothetical protein
VPKNDLEVFDHLLSDDSTPLEIDYLTYAVFAYRKSHWIEKYREVHGTSPSQENIDVWISEISDYEFSTMRDRATEVFHNAAVEYMKDDIEKAKEEGSKDAVALSIKSIEWQIKSVGLFRNQLAIALMTAILTPFILGGAIFFLKNYEDHMPSALQIFKDRSATNPPGAPIPNPEPRGTPGKS